MLRPEVRLSTHMCASTRTHASRSSTKKRSINGDSLSPFGKASLVLSRLPPLLLVIIVLSASTKPSRRDLSGRLLATFPRRARHRGISLAFIPISIFRVKGTFILGRFSKNAFRVTEFKSEVRIAKLKMAKLKISFDSHKN